MWFFAFLVLPLAGLAYALWHVYTLLPLANCWRWTVVALCVAAFMMIFLNFSRTIDRMPLPVARVVYEVGNSAIFVLLYAVMIFIVLDLGRLVHLVPRTWLVGNGITSAAIALLLVAIFAYGNINYRHKRRIPLHVSTAKHLDKPKTIVLLSDLHLGYHNRCRELARWVDLINAEKPDLILIGGDIIDISVRPLLAENMAEELRRLNAPVFACLGNHEYYSGDVAAEKFYRDAHITLLRDSSAVAQGLCIIGRDDATNRRRQPIARIMPTQAHNLFTILLDHQPHNLAQAERAGIDFQFSGHTHRGQVWPVSWITDAMYECSWGSHRRGNTQYYVSSGMGIWGAKFRIGTQSEYVVLTVE